MRMRWVIPALLLGSLCLFARPVLAEGSVVAVGGVEVLRIYAATAGKTADERADAVNERLIPILGDSQLKADDIKLVVLGKTAVKIMVKDRLLVTVTADDGKVNKLTALQQAQIWLKHVRKVLPQLVVKPNPNHQG